MTRKRVVLSPCAPRRRDAYTPNRDRADLAGGAQSHTAMMTNRLNSGRADVGVGAEVAETKWAPTISITVRISSSGQASAISVRFATVAFHTRTLVIEPLGSLTASSFDVMTSIAVMKMSAMMPTPRKNHSSPSR